MLSDTKHVIEITSTFKIGCMIACVPLYSYSCKYEDMIYSVEAMHDRYLFGDVYVRGEYQSYIYKEWEQNGYHIYMNPE